MLRFEQIVRGALNKSDAKGGKERKSVYEKIRTSAQKALESRNNTENYSSSARDLADLEKAITAVESEHLLVQRRRLFRWGRRVFGACAVITVFADLLERWFDVLHPLFIIGIVAATAALSAQAVFPHIARQLRAAGYASTVLAGFAGFWIVLSGNPPNGAIAGTFPTIAHFQQWFDGLFREIAVVQKDVGEIKTTTTEIDERTRRIERTSENAKRETSADPRKELANLGIPWGEANFQAAMMSGDHRVVQLFLEAGHPVSPATFVGFVENAFNDRIADQVLSHGELVSQAICTNDEINAGLRFNGLAMHTPLFLEDLLTNVLNTEEKKKLYYSICKKESMVASFRGQLDELLAYNDKSASIKTENIERCAEEHFQKNYDEFREWTDVSYFSDDGPIIVSKANRRLEEIWSEAFSEMYQIGHPEGIGMTMIELVTNERRSISMQQFLNKGSRHNFVEELRRYAKAGCEFGYSDPKQPSDSKIQRIRSILDALER